MRRLQSIQDLIFKNFKCQFYLIKRGFHIDGIRVDEDYRVYKIYFKTKEHIFNLQKGASILMVYRYTKTTEVYRRFNLY